MAHPVLGLADTNWLEASRLPRKHEDCMIGLLLLTPLVLTVFNVPVVDLQQQKGLSLSINPTAPIS